MANKDNDFMREELSSRTLELMLFREMLVNQEFLGRLVDVVDMRWFRTPHIKFMAEVAVSYYRKYGGLVTRDLVESVIQRRNDTQLIEANRIDLNSALFDFNKAKSLDLGSMDESVKMEKIQNYVKQEAMRSALLDSATDLEKRNMSSGCATAKACRKSMPSGRRVRTCQNLSSWHSWRRNAACCSNFSRTPSAGS